MSVAPPEQTSVMDDEQKHADKCVKDLVGMDLHVPEDTEIIDWDAALNQCCGDAGFLQELLGELVAEASPHMETLRECVPQGSMLEAKHAAHSIKGAAANLMCHRVRLASMFLEKAGQAGTTLQEGGEDWTQLKEEMQTGLQHLAQELVRFEDMLKKKEVVS